MYILNFCCIILCTGCTYAVTNVQTSGRATDIVDEAQSPQNDIKPDISVSGVPVTGASL